MLYRLGRGYVIALEVDWNAAPWNQNQDGPRLIASSNPTFEVLRILTALDSTFQHINFFRALVCNNEFLD